MKRNYLLSCAVIATCAIFTPALAAAVCLERDVLIGRLATGYDEAQVGAGLASDGSVIEIFVSETGTWTIIITTPSGRSCAVAVGIDWLESGLAVPKGEPT